MAPSTVTQDELSEPILPGSYYLIIWEFEALQASSQVTNVNYLRLTTKATPQDVLNGLHWNVADEKVPGKQLSEKLGPSIKEEIQGRLHLFSKAINTHIQCNPELSARLWGCIKLFLLIFQDKRKLHDHAQDLAKSIILTCLRLSRYLLLFSKISNLPSYVFIIYETILSFTVNAVVQYGIQTRKKISWTFSKSSKISGKSNQPASLTQSKTQTLKKSYGNKEPVCKDSFDKLKQKIGGVMEEVENLVATQNGADQETIKPDVQIVQKLLDRIAASAEHPPLPSTPSICTIPDLLHPNFLGRAAQLKQLKDLFPQPAPDDKQLRVAICGDSGVGKTQLALKYFAENRPIYKHAFFISATSEVTLLRDLCRIANLLDPAAAQWENRSQRLANVARIWISDGSSVGETKTPSIIIFDNVAGDVLPTLKRYVPSCPHVHLLFTTRDEWVARNILEQKSSRRFHLKSMSDEESAEFLTERLGKYLDSGPLSHSTTRQIAQSILGLPLALNLVAALSSQCQIPFRKILERFEVQIKSLEGYEKLSYKPEIDNTIELVRMSLGEADKKLKGAALFFKTLCFFKQECIPKLFITGHEKHLPNLEWLAGSRNRMCAVQSFFKRNSSRLWTAFTIYITRTASSAVLGRNCLKSQFSKTRRQEKVIDVLQSAGLLHRTRDGDVWVHDLISAIVAEEIGYPEKAIIHDIAFQASSRIFIWPRSQDLSKHREYLHLVVKCAEAVHINVSELCFNLGGFFALEEEHEQSSTWYGKALAIDENNLGREHRITLNTAHNMAISLNSHRQFERALEVFKATLRSREKVSGKKHRRTIEIQHSIASALFNLGRNEESLEYLERAIEGFEKTIGKNRKKTLRAMLCKGNIQFSIQRYDESFKTYKHALDGYEKILGIDDLNTLCVICNIAKVYYVENRYDEAMEWCGKALAAYELKVGKNHPSTQNACQVMKLILDGKNNNNTVSYSY